MKEKATNLSTGVYGSQVNILRLPNWTGLSLCWTLTILNKSEIIIDNNLLFSYPANQIKVYHFSLQKGLEKIENF